MFFPEQYTEDEERLSFSVLNYLCNESGDKIPEMAEAFVNAYPHSIQLRNTLLLFLKDKDTHSAYIATHKKYAEAKARTAAHLSYKLSNKTVFVYPYSTEISGLIGLSRQKCSILSIRSSGAKENVKIFEDIELEEAISQSDLCIISPYAITRAGGVIAKKGASLCAAVANRKNIPVYACTTSYRFDSIDQHRKGIKEPSNIRSEELTGIITEHGIHKPKNQANEIKHRKLF